MMVILLQIQAMRQWPRWTICGSNAGARPRVLDEMHLSRSRSAENADVLDEMPAPATKSALCIYKINQNGLMIPVKINTREATAKITTTMAIFRSKGANAWRPFSFRPLIYTQIPGA